MNNIFEDFEYFNDYENFTFPFNLNSINELPLNGFETKNELNENNCLNFETKDCPFLFKEEKSTSIKTYTSRKEFMDKRTFNSIEENDIKEKLVHIHPFFSLTKISQIVDKNIKGINMKDLILPYKNFEKSERVTQIEFLRKKKRSKDEFEDQTSIENNEKKKKKGRKTEKINKIYHGKYSQDNITKGIKKDILEYSLIFLNNIINRKKGNKLLKLNYKDNINKINKKEDLELLNKPLKDIFSRDISPKYTAFDKSHNKIIIQKILNGEEKDTKVDYNIINFSLNLSLNEFYQIFTMKETIENIAKRQNNPIDINIIKQNIIGIEKLLNDIKEKKGHKYFIYYIFSLYNLERSILTKVSRKNYKGQK